MKWKMLLYVALSLVISLSVTYFSFIFVDTLYRSGRNTGILAVAEILRSSIGAVPVVICSLLFWFIVAYLIMMTKFIRRISRITTAVQEMANGNLSKRIKVDGKDEIGKLEYNINYMVEQLTRSMEEERLAERTKAELVTNVSHDLRTPLTSILGYLGLVEQDRYRDEVELRHYIHIAYEKAERLHLMIEDLFEYTRMSGGAPLSLQQVQLNGLISQLYVHYRQSLEDVGMELRMQLPDTPIMIQADSLKLVRVLENLLTNAMKYGRDGGAVDIMLKKSSRGATIEVVNYGEPIPEVDLPHVFDRFYRADKSRGDDTRGSGLGLAIARAITELHGGSIRVTSDRQSTRFIVDLPLSS
ncbi:sensor histidine kinase [Paenibacillus marinisediminis]